MDMVFLKILNMSISASWLVLAVVLLRFALKKSPRWIHVCLWALVAVRLVCPFSIESVFSLIPSGETIPQEIVYSQAPAIDSGVEVIDRAVNSSVMADLTPQVGASVNPIQIRLFVEEIIWVTGMVLMLAWATFSYFRLKGKVSASIHLDNGVYLCDYIDTPFILGILRPRIYLPSSMEPGSASYVLAHERAHIVRRDHWWKPLGYVLLTVHWFNPVIWLAYVLLCRDIELACDEKVIRQMKMPQKKAYSEALLNCSVKRMHIAACPLAFGEVGVKERVKTVLNYRKPAFWIVLVAILALIVTAVCFLTDPVARTDKEAVQWFEEYAYENVKERMDLDEVVCLDAREGYALVYCQGQGPTLTLYRYEKKGDGFRILDSCTGEYAISGGMSLNHLEDNGKHIYFGTASQYHWNPKAEVNTWLNWDYMTLTDVKGKQYKKDMTGKEGFLFVLDAPMADFQAVDGLGTECLNVKKFTEQGYYMVEAVFEFGNSSPNSNLHAWTSTVKASDIQKAWAYPYEGAIYHNVIEGSRLDELLRLLNEVQENEIVVREPSGENDPLWNNEGTFVTIYCNDRMSVFIRYVDDTVIIGTETGSGIWEVDGYWVIENENLTDWIEKLANGGTYMLSDENREEIRWLLRMEQVQFFDPQEYDGFLLVGCAYDNGRGLGVAVYEPLADGYRLLKLIREEEVKQCASGAEVYYCDYGDLRIFLILNESITGMEWAGAYEKTCAIDTHPGLVVEYFPENLNAMYRFRYGGGAATMYMDWKNRTHGQAPEYVSDTFADPDDAYRICSNLRLNQVNLVWAQEIKALDETYLQGFVNELTKDQTVELLNLLRGIPENVFVEAEMPGDPSRSLEIFMQNVPTAPWLTLKLHEAEIYVQYSSTTKPLHKSWKFDSPELRTFIEGFFTGDTSQWDRFAPYPKVDGEISCMVDGVEIVVPKYAGFAYEATEAGIRFKPEEEAGWILLRYQNAPYTPDDPNLQFLDGIYFNREGRKGYCEGSAGWAFVDITIPDGDAEHHIVLLNEDNVSWVEKYEYEIGWILDVHEMEIRVTG